jgi:hypothetical protein
MPAILRSHPFRIINAPNGGKVLGVDEESGLVGVDGEVFFDEDGKPAPALKKVIEFQKRLDLEFKLTQGACSALAEHDLLEPWPVKHAGLYRVNEKALFNLDAGSLAKVRDAGGLNVAYCHLISTQQISFLEKLAKARDHHPETTSPHPITDFCFDDDDFIKFD